VKIFGPKRDELRGEWRKLHNQELNDLYSSPNIVQVIKSSRMRWARHVVRTGRREACIGFWWVNLRERDQWGDPRHRWEDNIRMDLQEVGCGGMNWIRLGTGECGNELSDPIKRREFLDSME
jgi:hypothetical protein